MKLLIGRESNSSLHISINKLGISKFEFVTYSYKFGIDPFVILTGIDTVFINKAFLLKTFITIKNKLILY
jgi:hypothetical protein